MELLAGARDNQRELALRRLLGRFELLRFDAISDFDGAIRIYRRCRAIGVTPRGMLDCMIAAVAWRTGATLLAHDVDLDRVAGVVGLQLDPSLERSRRRWTRGACNDVLVGESPVQACEAGCDRERRIATLQ
jgi:hypothetical protein